MAFQFTCPQGHLLSAEESHAGQMCQCPQCHTPFIIPSPHPQANPFAQSPAQFPTQPFAQPSFQPASPPPAASGPIQFASPSSFGPQQFAPVPQQSPTTSFPPFAAPPGPASYPQAAQPGPQPNSPSLGISDDMLSELPQLPSSGGLPGVGGAAPGTPGYNVLNQPLPDPLHIPCPKGHPLETPHDMLGQHVMCPFCQSQFYLKLEDSIEYIRRREAEQELADARSGQIWIRWAVGFAVLVIVGLVFLIGWTFRKH